MLQQSSFVCSDFGFSAGYLWKRGDLSAWLYRVGHLVAAETVRKRMRRTQREEEYASDEVPAEGSSAAENEAVRPVVLDAVDAELLELPARHREAVVLRYLRGHTQESAARIAADTARCLNSVRQICMALLLFAEQHQGRLPQSMEESVRSQGWVKEGRCGPFGARFVTDDGTVVFSLTRGASR
jgi:hypothetical protein